MPIEMHHALWLLAIFFALAASVWLTLWLARRIDRRARQQRARRAARAERDAAGLLEARGFEVLGRQVRKSWAVIADGEELQFQLIADYLVTKAGRRWVAEVKTGARALDLRYGPTRRQLLEYREAFAVEGVLLVDAEGQTLRSVRFPDARKGERGSKSIMFLAGLSLGLALAGYWFLAR